MGNGASKVYNRAVLDSLKTIKRAHKQLHVVTKIRADATPTALTSRLELYGVLLGEVTGIRSNLEAYLECARAESQIPMQMECVNSNTLQEISSL
jgi:hypothetical protein